MLKGLVFFAISASPRESAFNPPLKNLVGHREHKGKTNGYQGIGGHLLGKDVNLGCSLLFSVFSVFSVA